MSMGFFPHKGSRGMRSHSASSEVSSILETSTPEQNLPCWISGGEHEVQELKGSGQVRWAVPTVCAVGECRVVLATISQSFLNDLISLTTRKRAGLSWYGHIRPCVCVYLREFCFLTMVHTLLYALQAESLLPLCSFCWSEEEGSGSSGSWCTSETEHLF